jgi:hypothetical protein
VSPGTKPHHSLHNFNELIADSVANFLVNDTPDLVTFDFANGQAEAHRSFEVAANCSCVTPLLTTMMETMDKSYRYFQRLSKNVDTILLTTMMMKSKT